MHRLPENAVDRLYGRGTTFIAGYLAPHRWITPNRISLAGFLIGGVVTSVSILTLPLWVAGLLFAVGDILDCLDGNVARMQGTDSSEGAIVDETFASLPGWTAWRRVLQEEDYPSNSTLDEQSFDEATAQEAALRVLTLVDLIRPHVEGYDQ